MTRPSTLLVAAGLFVFSTTLAACSASPDDKSPTTTDAGTDASADTGAADAGSGPRPLPDGGPAPTWTYLFTQYFGPASAGHCGNAGCHQTALNGFQCLPTKGACYQSLIDFQLIDSANPRASKLTNVATTPLIWLNPLATMPQDNRAANRQAADEIGAWVFAGAKND